MNRIGRRAALRLGSVALAASAFGMRAPRAATAPVLVELFTSQGCNTCPPMDAYLGELARRADVVALSLHVDYWNGLGWIDPFSSPEMTRRQRTYARALGASTIYTPQMVVDGRGHSHRREEVERMIEAAASRPKLALALADDAARGATLSLPASPARNAAVWLALFDARHATEIKRGENGGRTLAYFNVVRAMRRVAEWDGAARAIALDVRAEERRAHAGCAVIVQEGEAGPVLGAALRRFEPRSSS